MNSSTPNPHQPQEAIAKANEQLALAGFAPLTPWGRPESPTEIARYCMASDRQWLCLRLADIHLEFAGLPPIVPQFRAMTDGVTDA